MPLVAIYQPTGERVATVPRNTETILRLRQEALAGGVAVPFVCPMCGGGMHFRRGQRLVGGLAVDHFYHHVAVCNTSIRSHPESPEHLQAKEYLLTTLPETVPAYREARAVAEHIFTEINRRADVAFFFPDGEIEVHEVQLSPITISELEERTRDYLSIGAQVTWHLGSKTRQHDWWCIEQLGVVGYVTVNTQERRLGVSRERAA